MKHTLAGLLLTFAAVGLSDPASAEMGAMLPRVATTEMQPLGVHVRRLREALDYVGVPLSKEQSAKLDEALADEDSARGLKAVQDVLDPLCLVGVKINPESRVMVMPGPAKRTLVEQGWTQFLVKVVNDAGVTARLNATSPQAKPVAGAPADEVRDRWLEMQLFEKRPMSPKLGGFGLEYRIVQLYSRDAGKRSAVLAFDVGQGTQDLGFRNDVTLTFDVAKAKTVVLRVLDEKGKPTTAAFVVRDTQDRVYPSQAKRIAPDFHFHPQVYRAWGEELKLPAGEYTFTWSRGPESIAGSRKVTVRDDEKRQTETFEVQRWIDPAELGWVSGDHHIHAAGCAHYANPTEGVLAKDMFRHCVGEDLKIGCNLTWGPGFDYQKQFFTGKEDAVSKAPYLLRYDVEVSGFGSHRSGHLCLLRLNEQIYPGGDSKHHWPTLCLNTLKWAQRQGAVCGPAHSGWGLATPNQWQEPAKLKTNLPDYEIPKFDGIGANEYIVDVTHMVEGPYGDEVPAVDFISTVDTPMHYELNIWYHTLNCGYRTRISGETDFPCIYGERVGLGRSYVRMDGKLTYDDWCQGVEEGRAYVSDGRSHLIDFEVNGTELGENGSEVTLEKPGKVEVTFQAAAYLAEQPSPDMSKTPLDRKPFWNVERSRIPGTRQVEVEIVVNGHAVASKRIEADGEIRDLTFEVPIEHSSWVTARILGSSHTNPVFVVLGDKPIRASRRSAEWCLKGVEQCWREKEKFIAAAEMDDAKAAYAHARKAYAKIIDESVDDRRTSR